MNGSCSLREGNVKSTQAGRTEVGNPDHYEGYVMAMSSGFRHQTNERQYHFLSRDRILANT